VSDVFVAGERVVEGGRLTRVDDAEILERVRESATRLGEKLDLGRLINSRWPVV
jgi:hypothetical protein